MFQGFMIRMYNEFFRQKVVQPSFKTSDKSIKFFVINWIIKSWIT
jgi:hypothetical protein